MKVLAALDRFRLLTLREIVLYKGRYAVSVAVVAASAALVVAVLATYGSITGSVRALAGSLGGDTELEVVGSTETGIDQRLAVEVARVSGVAVAAPMVRETIGAGAQRTLVLGVDAQMAQLNSDLGAAVRSEVAKAGLAGAATGAIAGPGLGLSTGGSTKVGGTELPVVGVVEGAAAQRINSGRFLVLALPTAQSALGKTGRLDAVLVVGDGTPRAELRTGISDILRGRGLVTTPEFDVGQADAAIKLTRDSTLMVAAVSLVVAGFLVLNSMNLIAARRRPRLALMRAVGADRRAVVTEVLAEAVLVGAAGAAIGAPLGVLAGRQVIDRLPPVLLQTIDTRIEFFLPWFAIPVAFAACLTATILSSLLAAVMVARVAPIEAVGSGAAVPDGEVLRTNRPALAVGRCCW